MTESELGEIVAADRARYEATIVRMTREATIKECVQVIYEQRCERGTPWDLACTTIAEKIQALANYSGNHKSET